jgi:hypothetical protein
MTRSCEICFHRYSLLWRSRKKRTPYFWIMLPCHSPPTLRTYMYGGMDSARRTSKGGLAPWQERRVKELMRAGLHEDMPESY